MKTILLKQGFLILFVSTLASAALADSATNALARPKLSRWKNSAQQVAGLKLPARAMKLEAHSTEWHSAQIFTNSTTGEISYRTNKFIEIGSGLNFKDEFGNWQRTREEFEVTPNGFVARFGHQQLILARDVYSAGSFALSSQNGTTLHGHVLAIDYYDPVDGRSVLLAQTKSSQGELIAPNQVLFADAFQNLSASVRYTYRKAGVSQDVILNAAPPSPESLGLSVDSRLEIITEWLPDTPEPVKGYGVVRREKNADKRARMIEPDFSDFQLTFGDFKMRHGFAFDVNSNPRAEKVDVMKRFETIGGRRVLIEAVEYARVKKHFASLPVAKIPENQLLATKSRVIPQSPQLAQTVNQRQAAAPTPVRRAQGEGTNAPALQAAAGARMATDGFLIDFEVVAASGGTDMTFTSDNTYYVTSPAYLTGTTRIEGGAVIKFAPRSVDYSSTARLIFQGGIECKTGPYRPAVFTAKDDDSVGYSLRPNSTGDPSVGFYGSPYLELDGIEHYYYDYDNVIHYWWEFNGNLHDLRISYAQTAISFFHANYVPDDATWITRSPIVVRNVQIVDCGLALENYWSDVCLRNVLVCNNTNPQWTNGVFLAPSGQSFTRCEHVTVNQMSALIYESYPGNGYLCFTNSLLVNVPPNSGSYDGDPANVIYLPNTPGEQVFQTAGAGNYYLTDDSPYRDIGTTSIDSGLLQELKSKTTYPPEILFSYIVENMSLGPTVARNTGTPDLGYHYDALDYLVTGIQINNAKLTIKPLTAVGLYLDVYSDFAIGLLPGARFVCEGYPEKLNVITWANTVQEAPVPTEDKATFDVHCRFDSPPPWPTLQFRFTDLPVLSGRTFHFVSGFNQPSTFSNFRNFVFQDCTLRGGYLWHEFDAPESRTVAWTNNVFERVFFQMGRTDGPDTSHPEALYCFNNLFYRCHAEFNPLPTGNYEPDLTANNIWLIKDNVFDHCDLRNFLGDLNYYPMMGQDYNAYVGMTDHLLPEAAHNVNVSSLDYQNGPFGSYYLNGGGELALVNQGSRSAGEAGLYHYVTHAPGYYGGRENNTQVDIGLHHILDAGGKSYDTDGDGIPDYAEDRNGDGVKQDDETDWAVTETVGVRIVGLENNPSLSGRVIIPLRIWPRADLEALTIRANGELIGGADSLRSPIPLPTTLEIDTRRLRNGSYSLDVTAEWNNPDGTSTITKSAPVGVAVQNVLSFPAGCREIGEDNYFRFEGFSTAPNGSYTMSIYDDSANLCQMISGTIATDGNFVALWDSRDAVGTLINSPDFARVFAIQIAVTDTQGNTTQNAVPGALPTEPYESVGSWVVSYDGRIEYDRRDGIATVTGPDGTTPEFVNRIDYFIVDQPAGPNQGGALHQALNNWLGVGLLAQSGLFAVPPDPVRPQDARTFPLRAQSVHDRLLLLLHLSQGRNFYWFGHSTGTSVADIPWNEIKREVRRGYRFVFLDSCNGFNPELRDAFGFNMKDSFGIEYFYSPGSRRPGAFLGYDFRPPFASKQGGGLFAFGTVSYTYKIPMQIGAFNSSFLNNWAQSGGRGVAETVRMATTDSVNSGLKRTASDGSQIDWDPGVFLRIAGFKDLTFNGYNHKLDWPRPSP